MSNIILSSFSELTNENLLIEIKDLLISMMYDKNNISVKNVGCLSNNRGGVIRHFKMLEIRVNDKVLFELSSKELGYINFKIIVADEGNGSCGIKNIFNKNFYNKDVLINTLLAELIKY